MPDEPVLCAPSGSQAGLMGRADGPEWGSDLLTAGAAAFPLLMSHVRPPKDQAISNWGHLKTWCKSKVQAGPHHPARDMQSLEFPKQNRKRKLRRGVGGPGQGGGV